MPPNSFKNTIFLRKVVFFYSFASIIMQNTKNIAIHTNRGIFDVLKMNAK